MQAASKVNLLLVDDRPENLLTLQAVLASLGQHLITATSGIEAMKCLLDEDFAVILLDVQMPELDGFETARLIRERPRSQHTPIIFLTASEDTAPQVARGYSLGAVDYLAKPFDLDALKAKVLTFVELSQRAQATHRQSEERYAALLHSALDAIITIDHEDRITEWNPAAEQVFGYSATEAVGKTLADLVVPRPLRERHRAALTRYLATGEERVLGKRLELTALRADGSEFPVELTVTRIGTQEPPIFTGVVRDITDRKRLEGQLRQQVEQLEAAARHKDEFLAMLAHELRNPLSPMLSAVEFLQQVGPQDPSLQRARETIERQVRHQARIINDLLDVSRISRGEIPLQPERLDLAQLVGQTSEDYRPRMEQAGLTLTLTLPQGPVWVEGDPVRLTQALANLLDNALKFANEGSRVWVGLTTDEQHQQAAVGVRDTGVGIDPEMLPHLFQTFRQADRTLDRSPGGLGLGLALVKGLVELHGGAVRVRSEGLGRGAEFTFTLPLAPAPAAGSVALPPASAVGSPQRVLIIEDNRDAVEALRDLLELMGHEVEVAYDGPAGVEAARQFQPTVVLCDIGLPGLDGYGVAAALRQDGATPAARLIAVTGYGQDEDRRRSREVGFEAHVVKPLDPKELRRLLTAPGARE